VKLAQYKPLPAKELCIQVDSSVNESSLKKNRLGLIKLEKVNPEEIIVGIEPDGRMLPWLRSDLRRLGSP
jgi:hypothetical protein